MTPIDAQRKTGYGFFFSVIHMNHLPVPNTFGIMYGKKGGRLTRLIKTKTESMINLIFPKWVFPILLHNYWPLVSLLARASNNINNYNPRVLMTVREY